MIWLLCDIFVKVSDFLFCILLVKHRSINRFLMMWKNLNVIYNYNNVINDKIIITETNMDCLLHVLSHLSVSEKVKCRLVCKQWKQAIDKLFSGQNCLELIYHRKKDDNYNRDKTLRSINTLIMTKQIKFQLFHQMMNYFPSIQTLVIKNLPLNDVMILVISTSCKQLTAISFISCIPKRDYFNNNYINNNNDNSNCDQITAYGWKLLINTYPFLNYLTIKNCSLTDDDCESILVGFSCLKYIDISDNDQINGSALHLLGI